MPGLSYAQNRNAGTLTLNSIVDLLEGFDILKTPSIMTHRLSWCGTPGSNADFLENDPSRLIYLVHAGNLHSIDLVPKDAYLLFILREDEPISMASSYIPRPLAERAIIARKTQDSISVSLVQSNLQAMFFFTYQWNDRCQEIVRSGGTVQNLVDLAERATPNWIDVNDATYNLIAYTHSVTPPDELSAELVNLGCHSVERVRQTGEVGIFKEWREQDSCEIFEPDERVPYQYITSIMRLNDEYYGHVVMVCNNAPLTPGTIDFFNVFSGYCQQIIERNSHKSATGLAPYQAFLENLLSDKPVTHDYIENQASMLHIQDCHFFRIAIVDSDESEYNGQPLFLLSAIKETMPNTLSMLYNGDMIVLHCAKEYDPGIDALQHERLEEFCTKYDCVAYSSGYGNSITDASLLMKQARIARHFRSCVDSEQAPTRHAPSRLYDYENAFSYYCCDFGRKDEKFLTFCLSHTLLDYVIKMEQDRDVTDVKLLYCFLYNERRATPTGEMLHMHRNNVLYRVRNIEKRYHIDLEQYSCRQYLLTCYRIKIQNSAMFRKLLT